MEKAAAAAPKVATDSQPQVVAVSEKKDSAYGKDVKGIFPWLAPFLFKN